MLPCWRRTPLARRLVCLLVLAPALVGQSHWLDPALPLRLSWLLLLALPCAALSVWTAAPGQRRAALLPALADALLLAALLAAAWPTTAPARAALLALPLAWALSLALGGAAANPFPPLLLALALGWAGLQLSGSNAAPAPVWLPAAVKTALLWFALALLLSALRLLQVGPMLAFSLPLLLACLGGEVAASRFPLIALLGGFVFAAPGHLPASTSGRLLLALLCGTASALVLLHGAAAISLVWVALGGFALSPWIEHLTLPRPTPAALPSDEARRPQ